MSWFLETLEAPKEPDLLIPMCERHAQLLRAYQKAVAVHSTTLDALEAARPTTSRQEYERLTRYVEQAHSNMSLAPYQMKMHARAHDCLPLAHAARA
jgi:hypothetical protein